MYRISQGIACSADVTCVLKDVLLEVAKVAYMSPKGENYVAILAKPASMVRHTHAAQQIIERNSLKRG